MRNNLTLLLIITICRISKEIQSKIENRILAKYKPLFSNSDGKINININYGRDFNDWLNDHFNGRNITMKSQNVLEYYINKRINNNLIISGKDQWLFVKSNLNRLYRPDNFYLDTYDQTANAIERLNNFCKNHNAKLYIIVAPYNEEIYHENLIGVDLKTKLGKLEHIINKLKDDTDVNILYAYKIMEDAKSEGLVQYKTDHHWTEWGAYKVYRVIEGIIFRDFNITSSFDNVYEFTKYRNSFGFGETYERVSNISDKIYPINTEYIKIRNNNTKINDQINSGKNKNILNEQGAKLKVFIFGDSYVRNIIKFFAGGFRDTTYFVKPLQIFMPNMEKEIQLINPDVVVMIIYSQNFELIKNWYNTK